MKARRVKRALAGYPLFDPPFKQKPKMRSQTQENFDYFMRVRADRLAFFQQWLRTHFDIDASLDRNGTMAVNRWVDRYGDSLFDGEPEHTVDFSLYAREWIGSYTGYNGNVPLAMQPPSHSHRKRALPGQDIGCALARAQQAAEIGLGVAGRFHTVADLIDRIG